MEYESECDVDDILCQLETLRHLRGLQKELGKPVFADRFPELVELDQKLSTEIVMQKELLQQAITHCGRIEELIEGEEEFLEEVEGAEYGED